MPFLIFSKATNRKKNEASYAAVEGDPNATHTDDPTPRSRPDDGGWPVAPRRVWTPTFWIVGDLFLLMLPIAFLALAGMAAQLDGMPLSTKGRHVQEAILLGPTLFPLAFTALGGRSLKRIALWKAERGTTLGTLEHLIGSQSLVSTVAHAISLHSLGSLPAILLILWALSPLGGQSALRLFYQTNSTITGYQYVYYADMDAVSDFIKQSYNADAVNRVNAVLSTSLMTADTFEFSPVDSWNHPKIPRVAALESDDASNSSNWQWFDIEEQNHRTYASLTGINIVNLVENADANLTVPYQYLYYDCSLTPSTNASNSVPVNNYLIELQKQGLLNGPADTLNSTSWTSFMYRGFFLWGIIANQTAEKLLYGSQFYSGSLFLFECSMNSVAVEANIVCSSDTCDTKRVRRLKSPKPKTSIGTVWDAAHRYYTFDRVIRHFAKIGGNDPINGGKPVRNPVDLFVYGTTPWGKDLNGVGLEPNWTEYVVQPSKSIEMSRRLTKLMNTYWDASRWPLIIARNDPYGRALINDTNGDPLEVMTVNKTEAIITYPVPIYRANRPWVAALILCSCVLFLLGFASFILSFSATAPDIFNYVSSFTRDNPYMKVPQGGTFLDGADRARLLRDLPVQLGDINPMENIGYIAMKTVEGKQTLEPGRVRKERVYY